MKILKTLNRFLLFISLFLLFSISSVAQMDSLQQVLSNADSPTEKVRLLNELARQWTRVDNEKAFAYARQAIDIGQEKQLETLLFESYYRFCKISIAGFKQLDTGERHIRSAMQLAKATLKNPMLEAEATMLLGEIQNMKDEVDLAIETTFKALALAEQNEDWPNIAMAYKNISYYYRYQRDFKNAKKYGFKAIEAFKQAENPLQEAFLYSNLLRVHNAHLDSALLFADATIDKALQSGAARAVSNGFDNKAHLYLSRERYAEALPLFWQACYYAKIDADSTGYFSSLLGVVDCHWYLDQRDSAKVYLEAIQQFFERQESKHNKLQVNSMVATYFYEDGDYEKAYEYLNRTNQLKDSIYSEEIADAITESNIKFETAQKEAQIARQRSSQQRILFIGILLLLTVAGIYQWYLRRQQLRKQAAELALTRQQAEADRLRELDRLKTTFFTNISHELRTPLTLILSPVADVLESIKSKPVRERLEVVQANGKRLLNLVNEIMDLSKVEAGKLELQESNVALVPTVKRIFSAFESLADLRRISFKLDLNIAEVFVRLDREKFEKILHNLLGNALKYTPAEGKVTMTVFRESDQYCFEVEDTGAGIHPDDLPFIFDRFYQAKNVRQATQGGTGVGLALSRELARLLGGELTVASESGKGSVFHLKVPLEVVSTPPVQEEDIQKTDSSVSMPGFAPLQVNGEKPRLLIVEDNPEMGKYLVQILEDHYQCVLANDGGVALKYLGLNTFDCITSDVMMPNMDGFELREEINKNKDWRQIPFLLLTARHLESDKIKGFQLGIDDYITKPFSTRELKARIHNLISNRLERLAYTESPQSVVEEQSESVDQAFLRKLENKVLEHLENPQFGVEDLAKAMNYSAKQLGRILKRYTGMSTVAFILEVRLQKARAILEKRMCASVMEAQLAVGISSTSYFTKKFTERFGKNPKEVLG